jgi:hypothetical protein
MMQFSLSMGDAMQGPPCLQGRASSLAGKQRREREAQRKTQALLLHPRVSKQRGHALAHGGVALRAARRRVRVLQPGGGA